ncbi:MAG: DEAD/DEAH box helicase [Proteobacteria bacterium]|nr:DEAD/DEAH box helicase [Pseudomonadota bacterium]
MSDLNQKLNSTVPDIRYDRGTLLIDFKGNQDLIKQLPYVQWDSRSGFHRCHAYKYRDLIYALYKRDFNYTDFAPKYNNLQITLNSGFPPRDYQSEALRLWQQTRRGKIVLPTGSGKSFLASMIINVTQRSTLILAPTIDLILQWQKTLEDFFQCPIGLLGGGSSEVEDITVSTYDSANNQAERLGNRFCLIVFDECHHLPSPVYSEMARSYIAPYRLGLTATPNEDDSRLLLIKDLLGQTLYVKQIQHLAGDFLAPYEVKKIEVELNPEEREEYEYNRGLYQSFRDTVPILPGRGNSWERFVMTCYRSPEGRAALRSFAIQKQIAVAAEAKMDALKDILIRHSQERVLIFTNDNKTAYFISTLFFIPLITHETKARERKDILKNFRSGTWPYLVNSRVLNEGVDVPEVNIAVIISGTSTVREHVQRLGRILRKKDNKTAILYELVTIDTGEVYTSKRRREHGAYARFT